MNKRLPALFITFFFLVSLFGISQSVSKTNFSGVVGSGARAFGMGGAFIAVADDATAASWNPGGLGQLENVEFSFVVQNHTYNSIFPAKSSSDNFFIGPQDFNGNSFSFDFASVTFPFRIGDFKLVPQISYQRNVNFTTNSNLNNVIHRNIYVERVSRKTVDFLGTFTYSDSFSGGFDMISFSLGTKIFRGVNIGFSVNAWMNGSTGSQKYQIEGTKTYTDTLVKQSVNVEYEVEKSFDIRGVNFNGGILLEIMENLKLGAVYKSSFDADVEYDNLAKGDALTGAFVDVPGGEIRYSGSTTLEWPETWGVGLSFAPIDTMTFSMDYTKTNWSAAIMRNFYNAETDERAIDVYFPTMKNVTSEDKSKQLDTEQIRFGMEYVYISEDILIPFRLGVFSDSQYYKDASGEKITFIGLTGGLGIKWGPVAVDFAIMFESGSYLESNISYAATDFSEIKLFLSTIFSL